MCVGSKHEQTWPHLHNLCLLAPELGAQHLWGLERHGLWCRVWVRQPLSCMCGVCGESASQSFSFLSYKMDTYSPHHVIVEIIGADVPTPSGLRFCLPEVFLPLCLAGSYSFFSRSGLSVTYFRKPSQVSGSCESLFRVGTPYWTKSSMRAGAL